MAWRALRSGLAFLRLSRVAPPRGHAVAAAVRGGGPRTCGQPRDWSGFTRAVKIEA